MAGFLVALTSLVLIDQALKAALVSVLPGGFGAGSVIRIRPARTAPTFAGRIGLPRFLQAVLWIALALAAMAAIGSGQLFESGLARVALGAAVGGAASNLIDVFRRGVVVDYVDLRVWPLFNLADVAIVLGVLVAIVAR